MQKSMFYKYDINIFDNVENNFDNNDQQNSWIYIAFLGVNRLISINR